MNRTKEEWIKYYENATKEDVIEDMMLDLRQLEQERNIRKEAIEYMKDFIFEPLMTYEDRKLIIFNENLKKFEEILNKEVK